MKKNKKVAVKRMFNITVKHMGTGTLHSFNIEATNKNDAIATATYRTNAAHNYSGFTQVVFIA